MESKVKALKVADLRDALTKAGVAFAPKATKPDLVAKALESSAALAVLGFADEAKPAEDNDDLLAPPAEFDWDGTAEDKPATVEKPASAAPATAVAPAHAPPAPTSVATPAQPTVPDATTIDAELEKRKKRAERFGVPLVEVKTPQTSTPAAAGGKKGGKPGAAQPKPAAAKAAPVAKPAAAPKPAPVAMNPEELEKRNARASRFGLPIASAADKATAAAPAAGKKRSAEAVAAAATPEEEERRKKRSARFGAAPTAASTS